MQKNSSQRITRLLNSHRRNVRPCNLCGQFFLMKSKFSRFCRECKSEKDVYRFAEWLPELPAVAA